MLWESCNMKSFLYGAWKGVGEWWSGWAIAHPGFGRLLNPILTRGGRLSPHNITCPPSFKLLPTPLVCVARLRFFLSEELSIFHNHTSYISIENRNLMSCTNTKWNLLKRNFSWQLILPDIILMPFWRLLIPKEIIKSYPIVRFDDPFLKKKKLDWI